MNDPRNFSSWVSQEAQAMIAAMAAQPAAPADLEGARKHYDAFNRRHCEAARALHPVDVEDREIAGVTVHVVTPVGGARDSRTLVCLHGGAFMWGSGAGALVEAVPVAEMSGMRVVAVDYRLAPEHIFPAAVDDAVAVYLALAQDQPAVSIGIYGASAGAILTGQVVARLASQGLDLPGAVAMLHGAPIDFDGDAAIFANVFNPGSGPLVVPTPAQLPYFRGTDLDDPLVLPGRNPDMLAKFPPSLLITGTRDFAGGATAMMHRRLLAAGVEANLVLFDGMYHGHHVAAGLPESRETNTILATFFQKRLA